MRNRAFYRSWRRRIAPVLSAMLAMLLLGAGPACTPRLANGGADALEGLARSAGLLEGVPERLVVIGLWVALGLGGLFLLVAAISAAILLFPRRTPRADPAASAPAYTPTLPETFPDASDWTYARRRPVAAPPPSPPAPKAKSGRRGCIIGAVVTTAVLLLIACAGALVSLRGSASLQHLVQAPPVLAGLGERAMPTLESWATRLGAGGLVRAVQSPTPEDETPTPAASGATASPTPTPAAQAGAAVTRRPVFLPSPTPARASPTLALPAATAAILPGAPTASAAPATPTPDPPTAAPAADGIPRGDIIFQDDFAANGAGWREGAADNGMGRFALRDGRYYVSSSGASRMNWSTTGAGQGLQDFVVQVEAAPAQGPDRDGYGIVFRFADALNHYYFELSSRGSFRLLKRQGGRWTLLADWTPNSAIKGGKGSNVLAIEARGSGFTLYANGARLGSYTDRAFASGSIGLAAVSYDTSEVDVAFDNLRVWGTR